MSDRPLRVAVDARCLNVEHLRGMGKSLYELVKRTSESGAIEWHLFGRPPGSPDARAERDRASVSVFETRGYRFAAWEQYSLPAAAARLQGGRAARAGDDGAVVAAGADRGHGARRHSVAVAGRSALAARVLSRSRAAGGVSSRQRDHDGEQHLAPRHPRALAGAQAQAARGLSGRGRALPGRDARSAPARARRSDGQRAVPAVSRRRRSAQAPDVGAAGVVDGRRTGVDGGVRARDAARTRRSAAPCRATCRTS